MLTFFVQGWQSVTSPENEPPSGACRQRLLISGKCCKLASGSLPQETPRLNLRNSPMLNKIHSRIFFVRIYRRP